MVKSTKSKSRKKRKGKGFSAKVARARKINDSTPYDTCTEQLSPFGGLLAVIKFLALVKFEEIFIFSYHAPARKPKLGHHLMVVGLLMLLFIGFNRIWHFTYVRLDAMLCGFFRLQRLPVASTFWRYLDSLGINQARSFLEITSTLRERFWQLCALEHKRIHLSIDTTVETIYGNQQGGRKGHNTKHRGRKGYRPVLCFIDETREYLAGKLRRGETINGREAAEFIKTIKAQLPGCVKRVLLRADGEFLSWPSVKAAMDSGFEFIIANKGCEPSFDPRKWYRPWKRKHVEYNSCIYQPGGWKSACRFVAMRMPKENKQPAGQAVQYPLFENDRYTYRIFATSLGGKAHKVIAAYDKRADVENLVGEAKREGLDAIPSGRFKNNYAFFQLVMLAYNIWRYIKILAQQSPAGRTQPLGAIMTNTIRIARLKLLFIAAKVVKDSNRDKVRYSIHDSRTPALIGFLEFLDTSLARPRPWTENTSWPQRFTVQPV